MERKRRSLMMPAVQERVENVELKSQRQINEDRKKERERRIAKAKAEIELIRKKDK